MKKLKKAARLLLTVAAASLCLAVSAAGTAPPSVIGRGTCGGEGDGSNLTWVLTSDGELTVSGKGKMDNYSAYEWEKQPPWSENKDKITKVTAEDGVTSIGAYAFDEYPVKSIEIGGSVESIGSCAFFGCALESLEIPGNVKRIGDSSFDLCTNLRTVTISKGVVRIEHNAFGGTALEDVEIPASVKSIAGYAFSRCVKLRSFHAAEGNTVFSTVDGVLFKDNGRELVSYPNARSSRYEVPDGTTTLGYASFRGCADLEQLTLPDSLKTIEEASISECPNLKSLTIPDGVKELGDYTFSRSGLISIHLPASVTEWPDYSPFSQCKSLEIITVEEGSKALSAVDNVLYSGDGTKLLCYPLGKKDTSFAIPEGVKSIGNNVFEECETLEHVSFPDGLEEICTYAFKGCTNLKEALLPDSVKRIGWGVFQDCASLRELRLPETMEFFGSNVFWGTAVTSLIVPSGLGIIDVQMCSRMGKLRSVVIPADVTAIEATAFSSCGSLRDVYFRGTEEQWNAISINTVNNKHLLRANKHFAGEPPLGTSYNIGDILTYQYEAITKKNVGKLSGVRVSVSCGGTTQQVITVAVSCRDENGQFTGMGMGALIFTGNQAGVVIPVSGLAGAEYIKVMLLSDNLMPLASAREFHLADG